MIWLKIFLFFKIKIFLFWFFIYLCVWIFDLGLCSVECTSYKVVYDRTALVQCMLHFSHCGSIVSVLSPRVQSFSSCLFSLFQFNLIWLVGFTFSVLKCSTNIVVTFRCLVFVTYELCHWVYLTETTKKSKP
jgi:hypothetical protein